MTEGDRPRTIHFVLLDALAIPLLGIFLHGRPNEWGGDNLVFLLLAKALATGQGYVDLHLGQPIPHVRYAPLFPVLLVPLVASGASVYAIKLVGAGLPLLLLGLAAVMVPLVALGGLRAVLVGRRVGDLYAGSSIAAGLIRVAEGPRLLLPAVPFLIACAAMGAQAVARWLMPRRTGVESSSRAPSRAAVATALLAIAPGLGVAFGTAQMRDRLAGSPGGWWPEADLARLERTQDDYVILTHRLPYYTEGRGLGVIGAHPERFRALDTGRLARAYRILPPPQASQTPQASP